MTWFYIALLKPLDCVFTGDVCWTQVELLWFKVLHRSFQNEWPPPASPDSAFRWAACRWAERGIGSASCAARQWGRQTPLLHMRPPAPHWNTPTMDLFEFDFFRDWELEQQWYVFGLYVFMLIRFTEWNVFVMRSDLTWSHSEIRVKPIKTHDSGCVSNSSEQPTFAAFWVIVDAFRARIRKAPVMSRNAVLVGSSLGCVVLTSAVYGDVTDLLFI